jgi:hypothetical protein
VQLYANLVQGGSVLRTEPVRSDGTYEFIFISAGSYSVVIDTSASGSLTSGLPSNWVHTGENDGAGVGNDGNTNGISPHYCSYGLLRNSNKLCHQRSPNQ